MTEMEFVQLYFLKAVRFAVHGAIIQKHKNGQSISIELIPDKIQAMTVR